MIAIIPARGGSKGVPGKNKKLLNGKPLIYYTIKAAINSKYIDRVFVSTDDEEIAEIAVEFGAEVPFLRPADLARDNSKAIDAYIYTVERLASDLDIQIDAFIVLLPTSPLRDTNNIDEAITLFKDKNATTVISVVEAIHPPDWYKKINDEGILMDYLNVADNSLNRQEVEKTYLPNGAIYIFKYPDLKYNMSYYNEKTYPYIMSQNKSIDIDTEVDFLFAEFLIKKNDKKL